MLRVLFRTPISPHKTQPVGADFDVINPASFGNRDEVCESPKPYVYIWR